NIRIAEAFEELTAGSNALRTLSQYETRLFRTFNSLSAKLNRSRENRQDASEHGTQTAPTPCPEPRPSEAPDASVPHSGACLLAPALSSCLGPEFPTAERPNEPKLAHDLSLVIPPSSTCAELHRDATGAQTCNASSNTTRPHDRNPQNELQSARPSSSLVSDGHLSKTELSG
ncbi:MAG TPA: hypothetical protein VEQ63_03655, partial [Bryobacteraceae bacterium]|nr:hypothetical protein [Bryobacteraceae bacterium]